MAAHPPPCNRLGSGLRSGRTVRRAQGAPGACRSIWALASLLRRWQVSHLGSRGRGGLGEDTSPSRSSTKSHLSRTKERNIRKAEGSEELHRCWSLTSKPKKVRNEPSLLLLQLLTPGPHGPQRERAAKAKFDASCWHHRNWWSESSGSTAI